MHHNGKLYFGFYHSINPHPCWLSGLIPSLLYLGPTVQFSFLESVIWQIVETRQKPSAMMLTVRSYVSQYTLWKFTRAKAYVFNQMVA